ALGPAAILVKDGTVTLTAGATAGIADVFTNHYVLLTSLFTGDVLKKVSISITPSGSVHAKLPVYFPTESKHAGDIKFDWNKITVTDSTDPDGPHLDVPDNLL